MLLKAPRCGVTPALTNKVKPRTHKWISAIALQETTEKQERPCVCHCVQCTWHSGEGPTSFSGYTASFGFPGTLYLPARPLSLAGIWSTPDLKDGNVVMVVILGQQGDLRPLPEWLLWVADFKVPGVKLEQSEYFYLDFKCISKDKHVNLL